ncbi:MAG: rRNA maturation RNase YbeY [Planctomycetota bacterium]
MSSSLMTPSFMTDLTVTARAGRAHVEHVREHLDRCLALLAERGESVLVELSVALVGDKVMSELHGRFSGDPTPTDVLTFELDHDEQERCTEGEVIVCVAQARRTAAERGTDLADELLLYALHGTLHLCGYDDQSADDFRAMHAREDELLTEIGVGAVFESSVESSTGGVA